MGKLALLLVTASVLGIAISYGPRDVSRASAVIEQSAYGNQAIATSYAHSAFDLAVARLTDDFENYRSPESSTFREGSYAYTVEGDECGPVTVTATGSIDDSAWRIEATYEPEGGVAEEEPPEYMGAGVRSGNNVSIEHSFSVWASGSANANVHADGNLKVKYAGASVTGFGSAGNTVSIDTGESAATIFVPNDNPDSLPVTSNGAAHIDPPRPDRSVLEPEADAIFSMSTISGTYNMGGTAGDPTIWIFEGAVKTAGDVVFTGNGIVLFDSNFTLESGHSFSTTGTLAVYVYNDFKIRGPFQADGLLYAGNNFQMESGTLTLSGPLTARNDMTFRGPVTIGKATPASAFYTPLGHTPSEGGAGGSSCPGGTYTLKRTFATEGPTS